MVVGGGTGWFLEELLRECQPDEVTYVELSNGMMEKSQRRIKERLTAGYERVNWVLGTVHDLPEGEKFDAVCTHCFLDLFEGEALKLEVEAIGRRLRGNASWYFSDFRLVERGVMRVVSRVMVKTMYAFFRWCCRIQAGKLGEFEREIRAVGFEAEKREEFFGGMIEALMYRRRP